MTSIYFLRHGTPEMPDGGRRYIGTTDLPLSQRGRREARRCGAWFGKHALPLKIYSSPLQRAWETALIVAEAAGLPRPVQDDRLREIDLGEWENCPIEEIRKRVPGQFEARGAHPWSFRIPGGETFEEAAGRFRTFLEERAGGILIVSHSGVLRAFLCELMGREEQVLAMRMPMAGITVLEEARGEFRLVRGPFQIKEESGEDS